MHGRFTKIRDSKVGGRVTETHATLNFRKQRGFGVSGVGEGRRSDSVSLVIG